MMVDFVYDFQSILIVVLTEAEHDWVLVDEEFEA